ncbi:MAG: hypothetical protein R3E12_15375 [Candidatus Eisenbacteria bacterium]
MLVLIALSHAQAGPNANGYLLLHTDDTLVYSSGTDYAGQSSRECDDDFICPPYHDPACPDRKTTLDVASDRGSDIAIWWVLAAFPPDACPRGKGVTFGARWDSPEQIVIVDSGMAGDFEIPTPDWPHASGSGTAVVWERTNLSQMFEVYWFAGYVPYGTATFRLAPHPTQGVAFADDAVPANVDPIAEEHLATLGFNGALGTNPYVDDPPGACCIDSDCRVLPQATCDAMDGMFQGAETECEPNPCTATPVVESSWGTIKQSYRHRQP